MNNAQMPNASNPRKDAATAGSSRPLWVLVGGLCGVVLYFAQGVFIPIALATLFALVLSSPVEALRRHGLPRSISAMLILVIFLGLIGGAVNLLWEPAQQWLIGAPRIVEIIERKVGPAAVVLRRIEALTERAERLTEAGGGAVKVSPNTTRAPSTSQGVILGTRSALIGLVTVVILTLFLLTGGPPMLARMTASHGSELHSTHVLHVIDVVRREVGRYYATVAVINVSLGMATGGAMMALGMPNPLLWGALAAVLNFIPYVGSATTLIVLTVVALVSFDSAGRVFAVAAIYLGLATIEGQFVQPLLVGQRLKLNPIIVFLALWIGGWFWGLAGIVIAVPSLVTLKVVAEQSRRGSPLVEFLSPSIATGFTPQPADTAPSPDLSKDLSGL